MEINVIEDDMLINIKTAFQEQYPYLTLRFYKKPHEEMTASFESERIPLDKPMEEVTMFHTGGRIDIDPDRTVAEVEHDFFRILGLCVQVFRKSGNLWLETIKTDHWTLKQQNETGRESCSQQPIEEPEDFNLLDLT
jgi:hypothetical protein